tara:strand:- start:791 stop:1288 length:498 start_codon:yes stop_codon:yes gene_type:complete
MIIICKSCNKNFNVPQNAIPKEGRLVQCSSCGNKWVQFPEVSKKVDTKKSIKPVSVKKTPKKRTVKRSGPTIYSSEYLEKKHGIKIKDTSNTSKKRTAKKEVKTSLGFYSVFLITIIFLTAFLGVLNLNKEFVILNLPVTEKYINYLFENINIIWIIFKDIVTIY